MYDDTETGRQIPFYHDTTHNKTQWETPEVPFEPFCFDIGTPKDEVLEEKDEIHQDDEEGTIFQMAADGYLLCCVCNKVSAGDHKASDAHRKKVEWWCGQQVEERATWVMWSLAKHPAH